MSEEHQVVPNQGRHPEDTPGEPQTVRDAAGLWTGILTGPVLWFAHQQVCFTLVPWVCSHGGVIWLHVATVVFLTGTILAGLLALGYWRREKAQTHEVRYGTAQREREVKTHAEPLGGESVGRTAGQQRVKFMAAMGVLGNLFFALVIVAQEIPNFFIDPCQR